MALIKGIIFSFFLLIGTALLTPSFASEDESLLEGFRKNLANNISTETVDQLRSEFKDTGLSPADVERIVADLADAIAACFLDSLVEYLRLHDIPLADLIDDGSEGVITFKGDKGDEFQEILSPCIYAARAEAGIAMD